MRIVAIVIVLAVVYMVVMRQSAVNPDVNEALKPQAGELASASPTPEAHSVYKRALDRANSVANQVRQQQKDDSF